MFQRLHAMLIKEFIQALRDPKMRGLIFLAPILQLILFGYVVSTDVTDVRIAIQDMDNTPSSREFLSRFEQSRYFQVVARINDNTQTSDLLNSGNARVVIRVFNGFERSVKTGKPARVQLLLDGTDSTTASVVLGYSARIASRYSLEILDDRMQAIGAAAPKAASIRIESRAWFNSNFESRLFYVPGVITLIVTLVTLMLTSMAIVREKEIGTIEQIMVSPIQSVEFILGKTLPFFLIAIFDVIIVTLVGVYLFDVPLRGYPYFLLLGVLLYVMTMLGIGLFISTISDTQQQAMITTFFFFQPAMLLSGFVFPINNMPSVIQWFTYLNPMRYMMVIVRGIFLKGVGLEILWPQYAALAILGVVTLFFSVKRFHKTLA